MSLLSVEVIQATTKVLWTSMPQQILYTIFKAIGIPFGTVRFEKRETRYETRILKDIQSGITLETLMAKGHRKTPEEKAAVAKQKRKQRRAKRKKEARDNLTKEEILQDDRFFCIAGYTSGGAPYGVTWEEKDLKPWEDLEENE
jgi:hypothetical protein